MNHTCPSCKNHISPFKRVKIIRQDSLGRKAGELGFIHLCPFCNESITLNKDAGEYLIAILYCVIPGFIFLVSFQNNFSVGMKISILLFALGMVFHMFYKRKYLKNHKHWISLAEYKFKHKNEQNT